MLYAIGPGGSKSGKAYELQKKLNAFTDKLNTIDSTITIDRIALDASEIDLYKK